MWLCECGKPLYTNYKWEGKKREILIEDKNKSFWRYSSVLPERCLKQNISLGEGWTPLISISKNIFVKD